MSANEREEVINDTNTADTPKWEIEHELDCLRYQIKYNTPAEDGKAQTSDTPDTAITAQ